MVKEDNQAAKRLSEDVVESTRTRHWDKEYHQIREEFERGTIIVEYCDTNLNAADVLTKSLSEPVHSRHTDILCGVDWNADEDKRYQSLPRDRMSKWGKNQTFGEGEGVDKDNLNDAVQTGSPNQGGVFFF